MISNSLQKELKSIFEKGSLFSIKKKDSIDFFLHVNFPEPIAVVYPENNENISRFFSFVYENEIPVFIKGAGSDKWDTDFADFEGILVDTKNLNNFVFYKNDSIVEAGSGTSFYKIQEELLKENFFLPYNPWFSEKSSVGGIYSFAPVSPMEGLFGGMEDLVTGVEFITSDGKFHSFGGRCIKNVTGYDFPSFMAKSDGKLALITKLFFKVYPWNNTKELYRIKGEYFSLINLLKRLDENYLVQNYKIMHFKKTHSELYLEFDDNEIIISDESEKIINELQDFELEKLDPEKIIPFAGKGKSIFTDILNKSDGRTLVEFYITGLISENIIKYIDENLREYLLDYFLTGSYGRYYYFYLFDSRFRDFEFSKLREGIAKNFGKISRLKSSNESIINFFNKGDNFELSSNLKKTFDDREILRG